LSDYQSIVDILNSIESLLKQIVGDQAKQFEQLGNDFREANGRGQSRWLGVKEAATYARLSEGSINWLLASGKLARHRPIRGRVLIDRFELDSAIASATGNIRKGRGIRR